MFGDDSNKQTECCPWKRFSLVMVSQSLVMGRDFLIPIPHQNPGRRLPAKGRSTVYFSLMEHAIMQVKRILLGDKEIVRLFENYSGLVCVLSRFDSSCYVCENQLESDCYGDLERRQAP